MPITLRVALATAVLSALVLGFFPGLDREVARFFFDASLNKFPVANTEWGLALRWLGMYLPQLGWMVATAAIIVAILRPSRPMPMRPSIAIFLIVTALAIPALVVNAGFKQHWGRPRPVNVVEFGGKQDFRPWWDNSGACTRNCSFMSGETSAAAMLVGAATLAPLTVRPFAIAIAGLFTLLTGMLRVAFGGHWLSDVLLGGSVSVLLMLAARQIILFSRGIDDRRGAPRACRRPASCCRPGCSASCGASAYAPAAWCAACGRPALAMRRQLAVRAGAAVAPGPVRRTALRAGHARVRDRAARRAVPRQEAGLAPAE